VQKAMEHNTGSFNAGNGHINFLISVISGSFVWLGAADVDMIFKTIAFLLSATTSVLASINYLKSIKKLNRKN
jgi:hypothetical protein